MSFDIDTYIRTQGLTGGPIITGKVDEPIPSLEPFTDEEGKLRSGARLAICLLTQWQPAPSAIGF
jgi:hypothetical protein